LERRRGRKERTCSTCSSRQACSEEMENNERKAAPSPMSNVNGGVTGVTAEMWRRLINMKAKKRRDIGVAVKGGVSMVA